MMARPGIGWLVGLSTFRLRRCEGGSLRGAERGVGPLLFLNTLAYFASRAMTATIAGGAVFFNSLPVATIHSSRRKHGIKQKMTAAGFIGLIRGFIPPHM